MIAVVPAVTLADISNADHVATHVADHVVIVAVARRVPAGCRVAVAYFAMEAILREPWVSKIQFFKFREPIVLFRIRILVTTLDSISVGQPAN